MKQVFSTNGKSLMKMGLSPSEVSKINKLNMETAVEFCNNPTKSAGALKGFNPEDIEKLANIQKSLASKMVEPNSTEPIDKAVTIRINRKPEEAKRG